MSVIKNIFYFNLLSMLFLSCNYFKDKLILKNNSGSKVCAETLMKPKNKSEFYPISAGLELEKNKSKSPLVRLSIEKELLNNSKDSNLYLLFYNCDKRNSINELFSKHMFYDSNALVKYSLKNLDEMNWIVNYQD